uniref:Keratin 18a, tandem duplicate 2 n=1 Tax=Oryzias sinensis TaxID=183150 RepID=A0A8C7Y2S9_9TELE
CAFSLVYKTRNSSLVPHSQRQLSDRSLPGETTYAYSVTGGAGGHGTRISSTTMGSWSGRRYSGSGHDYHSVTGTGNLAIGNEKATMQHLNDRLASYLETVKKLEKENHTLEIKIKEILDMYKGNAQLSIAVDNARLAAEDFKYELSMRQTVEADVARLRKILDETNVLRMHLEGDFESLKEELIVLKKNHEKDITELRTQITQAGVFVDVDAPKGQDLAKIMEEMRAKYEKIALKNQQEVKAWHESQMTEVQVQVTENTVALKEATSLMSETRRKHQALDIELQSALSLIEALKASLQDVEMRYSMELERYNGIIMRLQEELTKIRNEIQQSGREYELLLNIKVKLEAEIAEYRRLLEGGACFHDAVDKKKVQTKVVTITQTLVDGKLVSENKDVKSDEKIVIS